ncbi:Bax inhibitor-1/YccA family protein [Jatrophihabitans sp.]|uniref:Bax inhibitor-1/YccA family protein n=1 Tax=Jatrophihabitans sp. TaxID=1932789 RepID=UPI002B5956D5|nr:Bax inhibitor-1/YccA family protein [Jatrophihabitans sp.]
MASNPVLRGFEKTGRPGVAQGPSGPNGPIVPPPPSADQLNQWYAQPSYGQPAPPVAPSRYLTLDDVVTRSVVLLATVLVAAGFAWFVVPDSAAGAVVAIGFIGALVLGLYMGFTGRANAVTAITYAALQGLALGGISELFNRAWPGIVVQAITGTIMVAGGVLVVYKTGAVRVTPKFTKIVFASTLGVLGLMVVNLVASIFTDGGLGLRDGGALAIGFSLLCIVIAASNLIVDFDMIEQSVRRGVDEKVGWYLSWGILVTLVWLYLEILRLLSYLTGRNN